MYWTTTVSPSATVGPVPLIRTYVVRLAGGFSLGIVIVRAAPEAPAVTVGSRVMLVIPPADGYGTTGSPRAHIKGTDTLVFVVDILGAFGSANG